ncbi:hypothetical protein K4F52_008496 [Lecanicillium sp. MT-2017a]|nr:hypothetical protein K4F52_008496 [Lecanicillium sp. MT-2017a]
MSSMFKKKGGPAFKPKIPSARSRQAAPASAPTTKQAESQKVAEALAEAPSQDVPDTQQPTVSQELQQPDAPAQNEALPPRRRRRSSAASSSKGADEASARKIVTGAPKKGVETILEEVAVDESETASQSVPSQAVRTSVEASQPEPAQPAETKRQTRRERRASQLSTTSSTGRRPSVIEAQSVEAQPPQASADVQPPEVPAAVQPSTRSRRRASTAAGPADESSATPAPARPRKRTKTAAVDGEEAVTDSQPRKRSTASTAERRPSAPRRARSLTPEDSEVKKVDLQKLKMSDLTRDLHIGKKFSRHDELRERERQSRLRAKLDREGSVAEGTDTRSSTPLEDGAQRIKSGTPGSTPVAAPGAAAAGGPAGPQFRIVDGQIVVDQSSLVMDRHARAAAAQEDMETVEENDFTRLITSSSFMNTSKLRGPNIWTDQETELFYRGLSMFGTEFQMISHMFPGKQRRHIKLKFNREERYNPKRIDAALTGEKTTKMDIEEYKLLTGAEFESVASIEAEHREIRAGFEAERQRVVDEQAEVMRKKREELFADEDADAAAKKKGRRKGKQSVSYGLNGEPIYGEA